MDFTWRGLDVARQSLPRRCRTLTGGHAPPRRHPEASGQRRAQGDHIVSQASVSQLCQSSLASLRSLTRCIFCRPKLEARRPTKQRELKMKEHARASTFTKNARLQRGTFATYVHNRCLGWCINKYAWAVVEQSIAHAPVSRSIHACEGFENNMHGPV